jgi:hypothetical protein
MLDEIVLFDAAGRFDRLTFMCAGLLCLLFSPVSVAWMFGWLRGGTPLFWSLWVPTALIMVGLVFVGWRWGAAHTRLTVTSRRVIVTDIRTKEFDRNRMTDIRVFYDGGINQAAGRPAIEFELDGVTQRFSVPNVPNMQQAVDAILGGRHDPPDWKAGIRRRRLSPGHATESQPARALPDPEYQHDHPDRRPGTEGSQRP